MTGSNCSQAVTGTLLVVLVGGCHRQPEVQPTVRTQVVERQERVDPGALAVPPRTREDSLLHAARLRADSAAAHVDTIVAAPARLRLHVGDSLRFADAVRLEARDASGALVGGFAPLFHAEPSSVARLRRSYLVAAAPGAAVLWVQPMRFTGRSLSPTPTERPRTRVELEIVPR